VFGSFQLDSKILNNLERHTMPEKTLEQRLHYIDHLRGFMFLFMAIDHSLHAYALNWGRFWFFRDYDRSAFLDGIYLHDQSIIMPMLFFCFGMFVIPSLLRRGFWGYLKERFYRLGVIYVVGVSFIVPMLSYPKYEHYDEPGIGYLDFWMNYFFHFEFKNDFSIFGPKFQAGPFWVVHAILGFSLLLLAIYYVLPFLYRALGRFFTWCLNNPIMGYLLVGLLSTLILFISDIIWGSPWWISFGGIFSLQASRMVLVLMYFLAGSVLMSAGIMQDEKYMTKFANQWPKFLVLYAIFAIAYMRYVVAFHDDAFNEVTRQFASRNGGWYQAGWKLWPVLQNFAPPILHRTFYHGFMCLTQVLLLLAVFKKFFDKPTPMWTSLARNAFGIFIMHETIVVWLQYYLINFHIPILMKILICALIGISLSWIISAKILLKIPFIERILSPKPKGMQ
jgi:glucan biosynthesis protein C